jgi:hypothetical protein
MHAGVSQYEGKERDIYEKLSRFVRLFASIHTTLHTSTRFMLHPPPHTHTHT